MTTTITSHAYYELRRKVEEMTTSLPNPRPRKKRRIMDNDPDLVELWLDYNRYPKVVDDVRDLGLGWLKYSDARYISCSNEDDEKSYYCEVVANLVAIEKMAPSLHNQTILRRLKHNDPELVELWLDKSRYGGHGADCYSMKDDDAGDLGWLGYFIGKNTQVKVLRIMCQVKEEESSLCKEMAGNQSIQKIEFVGTYGSLAFEQLIPFFKRKESPLHLSLINTHFRDPRDLSRLMEAMQHCGKSLLGLELHQPTMARDWRDVDGILGTLQAHNPQLQELRLYRMEIGLAECRKLSDLICRSCLLKLDLEGNLLDDECISVLAGALKNTNQLKHLNISSVFGVHTLITQRGWEILAALLSDANCKLEELVLNCCQIIDNASLLALGTAVATNSKLKSLALSGNSITLLGWNVFTRAICDTHQLDELWLVDVEYGEEICVSLTASSSYLFQPLKDTDAFKLGLSYSSYNCNEGADTALDHLNNDKLRVLNLGRNHLAKPKLWQRLPEMLYKKCPSLEELRLSRCNIDDAGIDTLVKAVCNSRLDVLDLSYCLSVTSRGWKCVASLMKKTGTQLTELYLDGNAAISSDEVALYAKSLPRNDRLATLSLAGTSVSRFGWDYFFNTLCDTSSINNTYLSNHTLNNFGGIASLNMERLCALNNDSYGTNFGNEEDYCSDSDSSKGESYVRCCDKAAIAVVKIVNHHQQFDMSPLFEWDFKVLPIAVNWFDRAKSIEMEIEEHEYFELWFDENDHVDDDGSDESDVFQYTLPLRDDSADFVERVEKGKLNAIYQFVRGMPEDFVSLAFR